MPAPIPLRCPLKAVGLYANPAVATIDPKRLTELTQCDREKCGFWSSVEVEVEDDDGEVHSKVVEGCGVSVVAQHASAAADSLDTMQENIESVQESADGLQTILTAVMGVAARRMGIEEELQKALDIADGGEDEDEEGGEEEGQEEEQEEEARA